MTKKLQLEKVKNLPPIVLLKLINNAKQKLKKDPTMIDVCKEYNISVDIIDLIPIKFGDLDVSASTNHGIITLNYKLLCGNNNWKSYLTHEITHWMQQCLSSKPTKGSDEGDYLDNPYEIEAFQNQVEYIADHDGEESAEDYTSDLLDYHEINSKKEKSKKKEELLAKI
jgi:hypothetical protein